MNIAWGGKFSLLNFQVILSKSTFDFLHYLQREPLSSLLLYVITFGNLAAIEKVSHPIFNNINYKVDKITNFSVSVKVFLFN